MKYSAHIVEDASKPKQNGTIRLMCISDTHGHHRDIPQSQIFPADFLLVAGDFSIFGNPNDVSSFKEWMLSLPCKYKIIIPGNLDLTFDTANLSNFKDKIIKNCNLNSENCTTPLEDVKKNFLSDSGKSFYYLENSKIEIGGLKILGSPYTSEFMDFAFQFQGNEGHEKYKKLIFDEKNDDIDILITHGPPKGICDKTKAGEHWGDEELKSIIEKIQPCLHIFGHIHEAHGHDYIGETLCCNVAVVNENRVVVNPPTYIDLLPK